jgi:hypothetical protein
VIEREVVFGFAMCMLKILMIAGFSCEASKGTFEARVIVIVFESHGYGDVWLMSLIRNAAGHMSNGQASPAIAPNMGSSVVTSWSISKPFSL